MLLRRRPAPVGVAPGRAAEGFICRRAVEGHALRWHAVSSLVEHRGHLERVSDGHLRRTQGNGEGNVGEWSTQARALAAQHAAFWWAKKRLFAVGVAQSVLGLGALQATNASDDDYASLFKVTVAMSATMNCVACLGFTELQASLWRRRAVDVEDGRVDAWLVVAVDAAVRSAALVVPNFACCAALFVIFGFDSGWRAFASVGVGMNLLCLCATALQYVVLSAARREDFVAVVSVVLLALTAGSGTFTPRAEAWPAVGALMACNPLYWVNQWLVRETLPLDLVDLEASVGRCAAAMAAIAAALLLLAAAALQRVRR